MGTSWKMEPVGRRRTGGQYIDRNPLSRCPSLVRTSHMYLPAAVAGTLPICSFALLSLIFASNTFPSLRRVNSPYSIGTFSPSFSAAHLNVVFQYSSRKCPSCD
ncbi:unnamed protein product [Haemonchus placei]|uniref:Uncharacterized protein n=1 Tax=Haemonchus placei TaxID=6290 RepID=A0A3P7VBY4_HAEPC|nr:unnamed protein product [Haemonchus placei]